MANRPRRPAAGGRKPGRPCNPGKNKSGTAMRAALVKLQDDGWMHGGMVERTQLSDHELSEMEKKIGRAATKKLFVRKRRRNPIPPDEDLAELARVQNAVGVLHGVCTMVRDAMRLTGADVETSTEAVVKFLGAFAGGRAERLRKRERGEKINRPAFDDPVTALVYQWGLDFKQAPTRPKGSLATVAVNVQKREAGNAAAAAADMRYRARRLLKSGI
jgi:hypothetical protein